MGIELIQRIEIASTATVIDLNNIPQNFTDLELHMSVRSDSSSTRIDFESYFNGSGGTQQHVRAIAYDANSSGAGTYTGTNQGYNFTGDTANSGIYANIRMYIPSYSRSVGRVWRVESAPENKSTTSWIMGFSAHKWDVPDAITRIVLSCGGGGNNIKPGSTVSLFGITAGSDGTTVVS